MKYFQILFLIFHKRILKYWKANLNFPKNKIKYFLIFQVQFSLQNHKYQINSKAIINREQNNIKNLLLYIIRIRTY